MTTRLPAQTDTVVVNKNVHIEQIAAVLGLDADMIRSLNPEFRRDVIPGLTKPYAIRLPLAETGRFIDNQDSIFAYRADELLTKRLEVTINDDVPTFRSKRSSRLSRRNARYSRNRWVAKRGRSSARKGRAASAKRGKATAKKKSSSRRKSSSKRSRRRR
jgi:membrane-bound lytic murein transglycosylase D